MNVVIALNLAFTDSCRSDILLFVLSMFFCKLELTIYNWSPNTVTADSKLFSRPSKILIVFAKTSTLFVNCVKATDVRLAKAYASPAMFNDMFANSTADFEAFKASIET
ncbi:hypothetical protein [Ranid herpesvirus 3]|uniref:Uncharacterized protein n=1 Tax=Ranid herpesvirus 3 TaxID=1987509 RepID=A0A1X9T5E3_9VIRU|nr:hypothetical protein [Ranid herpesvirus 3]ARR28922.1 hypothetical protein [Ranid herpesvirus 3]